MIYFLKLIRWPNLAMTVLAVWVQWYYLIYLSLQARHVACKMDHAGIFLLGLAFAFVMGAGYVINDLFDVDIDAFNKGKSQILINHVSTEAAKRYYWILNGVAGLFSLYLAVEYDQLKYLILLPVSAGLLYYYSSTLKKKGLIGNLVIAFLCGSVLLLPLLFEQKQLQQVNLEFYAAIRNRFIICFAMATLLTLIREVIKDQEDESGDRVGNARTLPITWGSKNTNIFINLLTCSSLIVVIFSIRFVNPESLISISLILALVITLVILLLLQLFRVNHTNYTRKSTYLKLVMLMGMLFLPIALKIV